LTIFTFVSSSAVKNHTRWQEGDISNVDAFMVNFKTEDSDTFFISPSDGIVNHENN